MTTRPPFSLTTATGIKPGPWQEVEIPPYSDGDERHWPPRPEYRETTDVNYRMKLGLKWMEEQGKAVNGKSIVHCGMCNAQVMDR